MANAAPNGERVLVTGGTGYVAGWCIVELLRRGYTVQATVRGAHRDAAVRRAVEAGGVSVDGLTTVVADLDADAGWAEAVDGCDHVLHVASPMGGDGSADDSLIASAVGGTERVIRAARAARVRRVVMTSSLAAATPPEADGRGDESVWTDPNLPGLTAYRRSKALSERAAWDLAGEAGSATTLTTLLPGAIFGPVLAPDQGGSVQVIGRLLQGRPPALPRIALSITDVRDLAAMHAEALVAPAAPGERFVVIGDRLWMADIARILRAALGSRAPSIPTRTAPDLVVRAASWFLPPLRQLVPLLGRDLTFSADKARRALGFAPRPAAATIVDCAESLLAAAQR